MRQVARLYMFVHAQPEKLLSQGTRRVGQLGRAGTKAIAGPFFLWALSSR
jgi:hypothetical protein